MLTAISDEEWGTMWLVLRQSTCPACASSTRIDNSVFMSSVTCVTCCVTYQLPVVLCSCHLCHHTVTSSCRTLGPGFVSVVSHIFNLICVSVVSICITSLSLFYGVRDLVSFSLALLSNMSDRGTCQQTCIGHKRGVKQKIRQT